MKKPRKGWHRPKVRSPAASRSEFVTLDATIYDGPASRDTFSVSCDDTTQEDLEAGIMKAKVTLSPEFLAKSAERALCIVSPDTTEGDAAKSVDDETGELERICEVQGITLGGKPDDPPGDRCVPRFGERGEGYFIVWCLRSELIRMRAAFFRKQMASMPGIGVR